MKGDFLASRSVVIEVSFLCLIVIIGGYFRYNNLLLAPGWYPDEGSNIEHATRFVHGPYHYFAVGGSPLVSGRMPLYLLMLGWLMDWLGKEFIVARLLTATAGVVTIPLIYLALRRELGAMSALGAAGFFALMPLAVTYNRFAFSYNLHMPLFVIFLWASLELITTYRVRWAVVMAVACGAAIATELSAVPLGIILVFLIWSYQRRALWWNLLIAALPSAIYVGWYFVTAPNQFAQEMSVLARYGVKNLGDQLVGVIFDYTLFLAWDIWILLGTIGLFMITNARVRIISLSIYLLVLFNVLRAFGAADLGMHRVLGLLPFLAIGGFTIIQSAIQYLLRLLAQDLDVSINRLMGSSVSNLRVRRWINLAIVPVAVVFILVSPMIYSMVSNIVGLNEGAPTPIDRVLARKPSDTLATIHYLNVNVQPTDLVIASPQVGWAVQAQAAEYMQALSVQGYKTTHYPVPLERERLVYDVSLDRARFVVVDDFWLLWGVKANSDLPKMIDQINRWPIAFHQGEYTVYRNPLR